MADSAESASRGSRWSLEVWIALSLSGIVIVGFGLFVLITMMYGHGAWPWTNRLVDRPDPYEVLRSAAVVTGLIGAAIAATIAIRRQRSTERTVSIAEDTRRLAAEALVISAQTAERESLKFDLDAVSRMRDRYTSAVSQLGDDSATVRLGGVYALAALADDWLEKGQRAETQACIDTLCSYVRTPRNYADAPAEMADREIRGSLIRVVRDHLRPNPGGEQPKWSGFDLVFRDAIFEGRCSFTGVVIESGNLVFSRAVFRDGGITFHDAQIEGGHVWFDGAVLSGARAWFSSARFLGGHVSFDEIDTRAGSISFADAEFLGGTVTGPWNATTPPVRWPENAVPRHSSDPGNK